MGTANSKIGELDLPMEQREVGSHSAPFFADGMADLFRMRARLRRIFDVLEELTTG